MSTIIIVAVVLLAGKLFIQRWQAYKAVNPNAKVTDLRYSDGVNLITPYITALRRQLSTIQAKLFGVKQPLSVAKFRLWLAAVLSTEPALHHWLTTLSDEQLNALITHVELFTHEMDFELSWLLEQELAQQPRLDRALTTIVCDYCRVCYHAVMLQEDLEVYKLLRSYAQNPNSAQNREFGQALFSKLLEKGIPSIKVADYLALPETQRYTQIVETISQVGAEKQETLQRIVKELLMSCNSTEASAPLSAAVLNGTVN